MRWLWLLLIAGSCFGQTALQRAVQQGRDLTTEQADSLEQQVVANPNAVDARAQLIGHYFAQVHKLRENTPDAIRAARGRHIRWFIEIDPASEVLGTSEAFAMSGWLHDPDNYAAIRDLWLAEVTRSPDKLPVLRNATYLLQQQDRPIAVKLMRRAYEITSGNDASVAGSYGLQLGLLWLGQGGAANRAEIQAEIDASKDAMLLGSAGQAMVQYANPGGDAADYARQLLHRAIALTPNDRMVRSWEHQLKRIESGVPVGFLRLSGRTQLAKRISGSSPDVGAEGGEGVVYVNADIAPDGAVAHTIAISGPKELQGPAAAALKQWRFEPTLLNGKPVGVFSTFEVRVGPSQ